MNLLEFIDKGGIIVYILIFLNIIGFTIIIWKFTTLPQVNKTIAKKRNAIFRIIFSEFINSVILKLEVDVETLSIFIY